MGSANARDLLTLRRGLAAVPDLKQILDVVTDQSALLQGIDAELYPLPELTALIEGAIVDEPPLTVREGDMIRPGYDDQLDELRRAATEGKTWIAELQQQEQEATGIRSLKVRFNKVFGYYIEVSKTNLERVPENYIRKQTLTNAERFITPELKEMEDKVLGAEEKAQALEYELFLRVKEAACNTAAQVQATARAIGRADTVAALAHVALEQDFDRPVLTDACRTHIVDGRHPVVDYLMRDENFVPNDATLDDAGHRLTLITGPNMAGKSTYIRQVALLVLMAQMGSFIPAAEAEIGVVDRIFTRDRKSTRLNSSHYS